MSLILRDINFGKVFNSSGARNFFPTGDVGNGWRQHALLQCVPGHSWDGSSFIAKTTTLPPRDGRLCLRSDLQPYMIFPPCIYVNLRKAIVLNNVSLSGPGAASLLAFQIWQNLLNPPLISFMSVSETDQARLVETIGFCELTKKEVDAGRFHEFGIEFNDSCPNAGHDPQSLLAEAANKLEAARKIIPEDVPFVWKINALTSPQQAKQIIDLGCCDAVSVSNTIPWRQNATWTREPSSQIDWQALFGGDRVSPLKKRGFDNGGLSGWPLLPLVAEWVQEARRIGITIPIKAGGGIQKKADISLLKVAGADAIELGCVGFLRAWRLAGLIKYANQTIG